MHAFLHLVGAIVVVPYVALALMFLFIGQVARAKGLMAIIDVVLNNMDWFVRWGIFAAPVLWICLVAAGFMPSFQRASSLCLCLLAVASFLVVVTLTANKVGAGELLFLLPCLAVAATSAWLFFRVGARIPPINAAEQIWP